MPLTRLSEIARQVNRLETVRPDREYPLLGMRSRIAGPFLRETRIGAEISASRLNKVQRGDFIYSRLFAWQGSFGLIPLNLDGCYVSNEFPLFEIDQSRAVPEYLVLWFGLSQNQKRVEADCSGSTPGTRNRYKERYFLDLRIDLPDINVQRRIVSRFESLAQRRDLVAQLRQKILDDGNALLRGLFRKITSGVRHVPFAEAAPIVRRPVTIQDEGEYPELGVRSFGKGTFHKPVLAGSAVGSKKLYFIHPGDLVLSNVFAWEGAIAVAKPTDAGRVGSHRFITCIPNPALANADFLCFYLLTKEGIGQVQDASPGGAGRNRTLGLSKLERIQVPVPAISRQHEFSALQARIGAIRQAQADNQPELDALLPAILDKAFRGEL